MDGRQYLKHFAVLLSGAGAAQLVTLASYPLLARLYSPEEFGVFALFAAAATIIGIIASLRFEIAIPVSSPRSRSAILWLCIWLSVGIGVTAGAASAALLPNLLLAPLLGLSIALTGVVSASSLLLLRDDRYNSVSASTVGRTVVAAAVQIVIGLSVGGSHGLILGYTAGLALQAAIMAQLLRGAGAIHRPRRGHIAAVIGRYRRQSVIEMPAALLSTSAANVLNVTLLALYSEAAVGYYALAQRLVAVPLQTVNDALSRVFFLKAAAAQERSGTFWPEMRFCLLLSGGFSIAVLVGVWALAPLLIPVYLGPEWAPTAVMLMILAPMLTVRSVGMTVATAVFVLRRPQWRLYHTLGLLGLHAVAFGAGESLELSISGYLTLAAILLALQHAAYVGLLIFAARSATPRVQTAGAEITGNAQDRDPPKKLARRLSYLFYLCTMGRELPIFVGLRRRLIDVLTGRRHANLLIFPDVMINRPDRLRLGDNVSINRGCHLSCGGGLQIGNDVSIGHNTSILTSEHAFDDPSRPIREQPVALSPTRIGNNVVIGCRVVIVAGVEIADGTFVGAGSVVTRSVTEPDSIIAGVPARRIRGRFEGEWRLSRG